MRVCVCVCKKFRYISKERKSTYFKMCRSTKRLIFL